MKEKKSNYKWKLGLFILFGLVLLIAILYFVGSSQNLFGSTFKLKSKFKNVSGLKVDNNVLLSGINIGSVKEIAFISDSSVSVVMVIRSDVRQYIKTDAVTSIGSDGLMGDKVVTISPGSNSNKIVEDGATIASVEEVGIQDLMTGLKNTITNAQILTKQLADFSYKINTGQGALSKLLTDEEFAKSIDRTMINLETGTNQFVLFTDKMNTKDGTLSKLMTDPSYANSIQQTLSSLEKSAEDINTFTISLNNGKGVMPKLINDEKLASSLDSTMASLQTGVENLNELEEAAKNNFLLRGYFKKKDKAKANSQKEDK